MKIKAKLSFLGSFLYFFWGKTVGNFCNFLGGGQTCAASHKVKSSQSHDFDFFEKKQKSQSHDFDFFVKTEKSQSRDFDFFEKTEKSQSHDFDFDLTF